MHQGMSRTDIWKLFEGIDFTAKQDVGIVDKKANYIDIWLLLSLDRMF